MVTIIRYKVRLIGFYKIGLNFKAPEFNLIGLTQKPFNLNVRMSVPDPRQWYFKIHLGLVFSNVFL